jgi:diguanylate cyclase (GGDEF)-like protein
MMRWLHKVNRSSNAIIVAIVSPVLLTMTVFLVRAAIVALGVQGDGGANFDQGSRFDVIATMVFLVMLGAFNFSLAALVLGSLINRLRELSATDQLTGLANRRTMMHRLEEEHARYARSGQSYAVIMMDLDHFKAVNDTYGHGVGDDVLRELSKTLTAGLRQTDTLARTGGEEFMLLMPMSDIDGALAQARRVCERVAAVPLATAAGPLSITISLGVGEVWPADKSADEVVKRADDALYQAKSAGRNRVETSERAPMPSFA